MPCRSTRCRSARSIVAGCLAISLSCGLTSAHEQSRRSFLTALAAAQSEADAVAEAPSGETCALTIELIDDWSNELVAGLIRVTNLSSGKAVRLTGEIHRAMNWHALDKNATVHVPRTKVRIDALRGLRTELASQVIDLTNMTQSRIKLTLKQFYETRLRGQYAGNTHLHLMNLTHAEADRYLRVVPQCDDLDLVFLSFLRRIPDERNYISNIIVENSFTGGDLQRLSRDGVLFANGQEHRHNFGRYDEGYGHVMLLELQKLIRPVSIGPGIMGQGTDGLSLRRGMQAARADGATVIWCHNTFGFEDLPNWVSGLIHAQNIFDGGMHGTYADTFYRYLNLGMRVPFSTGTDWFIYDFSRVYVPVDGELNSAKWLEGLRMGRSFITNGPFLELETERAGIGGTLNMEGPNRVTVIGRGMGRLHFGGLELVYNGKVVHQVPAVREGGYHVADLRHGLEIDEPGWFALRIPLEAGKSELDRPLFAHTSPIYVQFEGRQIFDEKVAEGMVSEMRDSLRTIREKSRFADAAESESVLSVYERGIAQLQEKIDQARRQRAKSSDVRSTVPRQ